MKTNWTTAKGSKIEIEINHKNGMRSGGTISINGAAHTAKIEKINGTWVAKMENNVCVALPSNVFAAIETDRESSHTPLTAERLAEVKKFDRIAGLEIEMKKWEDTDNVKYIKARDAWLAEISK